MVPVLEVLAAPPFPAAVVLVLDVLAAPLCRSGRPLPQSPRVPVPSTPAPSHKVAQLPSRPQHMRCVGCPLLFARDLFLGPPLQGR